LQVGLTLHIKLAKSVGRGVGIRVEDWKAMEDHWGLILIADDDAGFRVLVSTSCLRAGYRCVEAASGAEAVSAALAERPDVALVDDDLGDASGYEVCRDLRDRFGEGMPIIFISHEDRDVRPRGRLPARWGRPRHQAFRARRADGACPPGDHEDEATQAVSLVEEVPSHPPRAGDSRAVRRGSRNAGGLRTAADQHETVSSHTQRVLPKLGVHRRTEAVALAYREGLFETAGAPRA
jgi:CheY-like chemotaxis protein